MLSIPIVRPLALVACGLGAALPAFAQERCALPYETYEIAVPHTDLETCPASVQAAEGTFCRVSVVAEVATVFVFADADECLVASKSFFEGEFTLALD